MNINLTMLGQAISFAVFVWFCVKYVWPPIINALEERESRIADGLAAAEKGQQDLESAGQKVVDILQEGREKAQGFVVQSQQRGEEIIEQAKQAAVEEGDRLLVAAHGRIDQERTRVHRRTCVSPVRQGLAACEPGP